MDSERHILRYVFPGFVLSTEVALYVWLLSPGRWGDFRRTVASASAVIALIAGSGGLGYFLGMLYYLTLYRLYAALHRAFLHRVETRATVGLRFEAVGPGWNAVCIAKQLSLLAIWRVMDSLWWEKQQQESTFERLVIPRVDRLYNVMHSAGTTFIGSLVAIALWYLIDGRDWWVCFRTPWACVPFAVALLHVWSYGTMVRSCRATSETLLWREFFGRERRHFRPIAIPVHLSDRRLRCRLVRMMDSAPHVCRAIWIAAALTCGCLSRIPARVRRHLRRAHAPPKGRN